MSKIKSNMIKDEITSSINNTNVQYSYNEHTQNINNNSNIIIKKDISDTNMSEKSISTVTFNKLLTKLCSYNVECIGLYLLIIIVFIGVLFFDHKNIEDDEEANEIQDDANEWYFKCNIENIELFCNLVIMIFMFVLFIKAKELWEYTYIYKCCIYISYYLIIWIFFGPFINVKYINLIIL